MTRTISIIAILAAGASLAGCGTVFGTQASPNFQALISDIQGCDRDYTLTFGASTAPFNGSAQVHCKAKALADTVALPAPAADPAGQLPAAKAPGAP